LIFVVLGLFDVVSPFLGVVGNGDLELGGNSFDFEDPVLVVDVRFDDLLFGESSENLNF
jgi:hypothetical protein